jgi:streptogramin lyase
MKTKTLRSLIVTSTSLLVFTGLSVVQVAAQTYKFSTLAGLAGNPGSLDTANDSTARFFNPTGVAVDNNGNVYVADTDNDTIRKMTPGGVVTTLAGSAGNPGSADGTGNAAQFYHPFGVAVDNNGNVYVADSGNSTIREISPSGVVTTLAGSAGNSGSADGTGSNAQFRYPAGVAVDANGNVYVADTFNYTIRKITPGGVVTTPVGSVGISGSADGTGSAAQFYNPFGVAVDNNGNVYVADSGNSTIREISPSGVVTTLAGSAGNPGSADGTGSNAQFSFPESVAVDASGNVYVADTDNDAIRQIAPGGVVTTLAGSVGSPGSADGTGNVAQFYNPVGVAVDNNGNVYVTDTGNNTIRMFSPGGVVTTLAGRAGSSGSADGVKSVLFNMPAGVAVDTNGNLYVADTYNETIRKITLGGVVTTLAGSAGSSGSGDGTGTAARFYNPFGVAVDNNGNLYVADTYNSTIRKIAAGGIVTTLAGSAGNPGSADGTGNAARFDGPYGVAVDTNGNVYVADAYNDTIRVVTPGGVVTTLAGSAGNSGSADGTGSAARFSVPKGVAVDVNGNVYVADTYNYTIRKITPGGVVTTLAGSARDFGTADGTGSATRFYYPDGVAVDVNGNVYVADSVNNNIRKITPGGVVTTLGGLGGIVGSADGIGSVARFYNPNGVAVDANGNVYVADTDNDTIREGMGVDFSAFRILNLTRTNNDILLTWQTFGSSTNVMQAAPSLPGGSSSNCFVDFSPPIAVPGNQPATTNFLDVGGATNASRFYRVRMAGDMPIAVTGYNRDVVVERAATGSNTAPYALAFDAEFNYGFYEAGLNAVTVAGGNATPEGLPQGGAFTSVWDGVTTFQIGPYTGDNVLYMNIGSPSATLGLAAPARYDSLTILATSANGGGSGSFVINFADNTSSSPISFNAPDWYNNTGMALTHFGRILIGVYNTFETDDSSGNNPNLYQTSVNLAALGLNTKPIASLTFTMPSGGGTSANTATGVFALSGTLSR